MKGIVGVGAICTVIIATLLIGQAESNKAICKEIVVKLLKGQLAEITNCMNKLGLKEPKDRVEKMSCVLKCVLQKEGFIADDGSADPAATLGFIERHIPESDRERATMVIMDCQDAAANLKPDEANCKSYDVLIKCAMGAMNKFCS